MVGLGLTCPAVNYSVANYSVALQGSFKHCSSPNSQPLELQLSCSCMFKPLGLQGQPSCAYAYAGPHPGIHRWCSDQPAAVEHSATRLAGCQLCKQDADTAGVMLPGCLLCCIVLCPVLVVVAEGMWC